MTKLAHDSGKTPSTERGGPRRSRRAPVTEHTDRYAGLSEMDALLAELVEKFGGRR